LALNDERDFVRQVNIGGEAMREEDIARVRRIGSQLRWRNTHGVQTEFLTADEMDNLCIRKGTLTAAERDSDQSPHRGHHQDAGAPALAQTPEKRA
jgi:hypothetical protein